MAAPPNPSDFVTAFPELAPAGNTLIGSKLATALTQVDYSVYGDASGDQAVLYLAAHLIALSPYGRAARLVNKDGSTSYEGFYKNLQANAACGFRVV